VVVYRYNIEVEHAGGGDLSFVVFRDRALLPNEAVRDFGRDRNYVIVEVAETTSHDPLDPSVLHGSAIARPSE
jgi:hypothetical protein